MNLYPIITTPEPLQCRDFYVRAFGARVLFQTDWYVHLRVQNWELGFLKPNPPQRLPVFQHASLSRGLCFAVEVDNAAQLFEQLRARGIETLGKPQQSSSGELAFSVMDPAGVILNVVEIKPDTSQIVTL